MPNTCHSCGAVERPSSTFCTRCGNPMSLLGTSSLPQNFMLHNRYVVMGKIGQGGMGAVYEVADARLANKPFALKEMSVSTLKSQQEQAQARAAFEHEAKILAQLDHLNIPQITDFFTENNKHYMVMELVKGITLEQYMQREARPCTEQQARTWALQLCDVLAYLHGQQPPVIFRDLKPANVMLASNGQLKLIDFGIARLFKSGKTSDTQHIGTHGYAPPEQYGEGQTDPRSDIYSLGVVLHHLLTGHNPAKTPFNLPPVRQLNPHVSSTLEHIILIATHYEIGKRYPSIAALKQALLRPKTARSPVRAPRTPVIIPSSQSAPPRQKNQPAPNELPTRVNLNLQQRKPAPARQQPKTKPKPISPRPKPVKNKKQKKKKKRAGCVSCLVRVTVLLFTLILLGAAGGLLIYNFSDGRLPDNIVPELSNLPNNPTQSEIPEPALLANPPASFDSTNLIAYTSRANGRSELYISNAANNQAWLLPGQPANSSLAAWSPGGERLTFRVDGNGRHLYAMNPDGSELRQLTSGASRNIDPAWSPDGYHIAFSSNRTGNYELYIMDADGSNVRRVTFIENQSDNDPNWSPDGQWFVFESGLDDRYHIYKIRIDGSELTPLATDGDSNSTPAWSPNGEQIAFERREGNAYHIWLMDSNGNNLERLTSEGTINQRPAWSPDGKQIAFTSNRDGEFAIWIIHVDGEHEPYRLTPVSAFDPAWTR